MIKNVSRLEVKIEDRNFQLFCEQDSPIEDCKKALYAMVGYLAQVEDAHKNQEADKGAEAPSEEVPVVEAEVCDV